MKKNVTPAILLLTTILVFSVFSSTALATDHNNGKRVFARELSANDLAEFLEKGCVVLQDFKKSKSKALRCPSKTVFGTNKKILPDLRVYALDLDADTQIKATDA
ncbi:MAG: hypothetical protein ACE5DI_06360, partial [Candidatus Micrarchaeia archaeon]